MGSGRVGGFSRNEMLENLLKDLNSNLRPAEEMLLQRNRCLPFPVILIMGAMRSGTTLFMQWLANLGVVAYPTNLLARFYGAPILGAKIQLLLTDPRFSFRNELGEFLHQVEYISENGKTKGVLAPNEFWYFWRRFLPEWGRDVWTDEELKEGMDVETMKAELAGVMDVFQKPFAAKGMLFNYNIPFLDSVLDKVVFVWVRRDPLMNIQSVLGARKRQLGAVDRWYSFDIPEKNEIVRLPPVEQVAAQVACIQRAVMLGLRKVAPERKLAVPYEEFCSNPQDVFVRLTDRLRAQGADVSGEYKGPPSFEVRGICRLGNEEQKRAMEVFEAFFARDA